MAFALLVEDGSGLANANSYVSVDAALDIVAGDPFLITWATLTSDVQSAYLAKSTQVIDSYMAYTGQKATQAQGLAWPRKCAVDPDGYAIAINAIPALLKTAVALYAANLAQNGNPEAEIDAARGIKSLKADVVEVVFENGDKKRQIPETITFLLASLGRPTRGGTLKVVRT